MVVNGNEECKAKSYEPPGGGLNKPTDRNQQSWFFLNYPKKYFTESKTLENTLQNIIHLAKLKHNMIIMENSDY